MVGGVLYVPIFIGRGNTYTRALLGLSLSVCWQTKNATIQTRKALQMAAASVVMALLSLQRKTLMILLNT